MRSLVGVVNQPRVGPATSEAHLQRVDDQLCAHVLGHRPADDRPREGVLHRRRVDPALPAAQIGDVSDPEHVGGSGAEVPLHQVIGDPHPWHPDCGSPALFGHQAADPGLAHQPLHPLSRDLDLVAEPQLGVDAPGIVDAAGAAVDLADALG